MVRSIFLRGFDQDMANKIGKYMADHHTKFIHNATPSKLEKPDENGRIKVTYVENGEEKSDEYDTVLFAIGRYAGARFKIKMFDDKGDESICECRIINDDEVIATIKDPEDIVGFA